MWPFRQERKTIADLPKPSFDELKRRTTVLVIDDVPESFPVAGMQREGYNISYWEKVETLAAIENGQYDIIILDIQGVAQHISKDDGLGVLELIKQRNPSQIVVAFSLHQFDLDKNRFWRLADDSLSKPVDLARCKRVVDAMIEQRRTPEHYWATIRSLLHSQGLGDKSIASAEDKIVRALLNKNAGDVRETLKKSVDNAEVGVKVMGVGLKIAALLGLSL